MELLVVGGLFFAGFGSGAVTALYFVRQYFQKAKAAGKIPQW